MTSRRADVEKGFVSIDEQIQNNPEKKMPKSKPRPLQVPSSEFEIDSPKSPFLNRVLGRK